MKQLPIGRSRELSAVANRVLKDAGGEISNPPPVVILEAIVDSALDDMVAQVCVRCYAVREGTNVVRCDVVIFDLCGNLRCETVFSTCTEQITFLHAIRTSYVFAIT